MIDARFKFENEEIKEVRVAGHANHGPPGQDIVCASVSVLVQAVANEIKKYSSATLGTNDGYAFIFAEKSTEAGQALLIMLLNAITDIAEEYPECIKVNIE